MKARYLLTIIVSFFVAASVAFGTSALSYFTMPVSEALGVSRAQFTLYITFMNLIAIISMPVIGNLIAKFGAKKLVVIGGIWLTICYVGLSFSNSLILFYVIGTLMGIALTPVTIMAAATLINTWFIKSRGLITGIVMASSGIVGTVMGLFMPDLIANQGWQFGYLLLGILTFIFMVPLTLIFLKDKPSDAGLPAYGAEVTATASSGGKSKAVPSGPTGVSFKTALRSPQTWMFYLALILLCSVTALLQHLPALFVGKGFTGAEAGQLMSFLMLALIAAKILTGIVNDRLGAIVTVIIVVVLYVVSLLLISFTAAFIIVAVAMVIMSFGNAAPSVMGPVLTGTMFGQKSFAQIWGFVGTGMSIGSAAGAPLWGLVYDATGSYDLGIIVASALLVLAAILITIAVRTKGKMAVEG
jgi:sugar phosphate permease